MLKTRPRPGLQGTLGLQGTIGKQNIEAAKAILQAYQVSVQKENLGGDKGRKILFYSSIGKVLVKEISSSFPQDNNVGARPGLQGTLAPCGRP